MKEHTYTGQKYRWGLLTPPWGMSYTSVDERRSAFMNSHLQSTPDVLFCYCFWVIDCLS